MAKRTNHVVTSFKPHNEGLAKLFGSLEADIIELLWARKEASARDLFEDLRTNGQRLSYGAVKTVLDRLVKKAVLQRAMHNNQYMYRSHLTRAEFEQTAIREIIGSLVDSFGAPVYAQFVDQVKEHDPEQLERLAQLINEAEHQE